MAVVSVIASAMIVIASPLEHHAAYRPGERILRMIAGLDGVLEGSQHPGLAELRAVLQEVLDGRGASGRFVGQDRLKSRVYRLHFEIDGRASSLVVKRLHPGIAQRNQFVVQRWLPAIGLSQSGPPLLGTAAERSGQWVWHVYEDLGDWALEASQPDPERVQAAMELIAQIHLRFAGHPLLGECRLWGGDFGSHFYSSNVCDAIRSLEALRPPAVTLAADHLAVRDRLLERLDHLRTEQADRARLLIDVGGPETLLHGDLWPTNTLVCPLQTGVHVRLIDWDHAGVGPISYDLSTFLSRCARPDRQWILGLYQQAVSGRGWRLPSVPALNRLFDTAECARLANRVIWPALAVLEGDTTWGFEELAAIEQWFDRLEPILLEEA